MMRTITVKGVGSVSARPDYITLSLGIETQEKEYDDAMQKATERINSLEAASQKVGFEKGDLKTTSFNVSTSYESVKDRSENYKREFAGYNCSYRLKLAFDFDGKRLAEVLSAISISGAKPELSIAFTVKDATKVSEELLMSATKNAREKAEILCRASGAELGILQSIDYNWGELNIVSRTSYEMEDCIMPMMALRECATPEIEPDDIDLRDTATFVWEIA